MLKIGLTGGIGSGKSLISRIFSILGVPVFHSDEVSKYLINNNQDVVKKVSEIFGSDIYRNGILDNKRVSEIVFHNKQLLADLNSVMHPAVNNEFDRWVGEHTQSFYVLKETAILYESGTEKDLDFVVSVTAPESLRISRVMERDCVSREEVISRIQAQLNEEERNSFPKGYEWA